MVSDQTSVFLFPSNLLQSHLTCPPILSKMESSHWIF
uniref:Uncharacterized protein n=1 Tax=Anguilla anguilla TaxID=7936 RepID=A0A0E9S1I5_ANGAN